jgi:hypothetical protein
MSLKDRDYMQRPEGDDGERPPKPRIWILVVALVLVGIFLLSLWPRR